MDMRKYFKNRVAFSLAELAKHRGEWVAWSPDGARVIAASRDPDTLDDLIRRSAEKELAALPARTKERIDQRTMA